MGAYPTQAIIISQVILIKVGCSGSHPLNPSHFNLQASPLGLERPPSRASSAVKLQAILSKVSYFGRHPLMPGHCLYQLSFPYGLIIAHSSWFVKNFFLKSQFYFLGFRLHLLLSRSAPLRNDWWKNWKTPHGIGLLKSYPLELSLFVPLLYHILGGLSRTFFLGAVVGVEPTFSKGERFQGCDPVVSQPFYRR